MEWKCGGGSERKGSVEWKSRKAEVGEGEVVEVIRSEGRGIESK